MKTIALRKIVQLAMLGLVLALTSNVYAANKEKIVLVSGIDFARTGQCGFVSCPNGEYLYSDEKNPQASLEPKLNSSLDRNMMLADIYSFEWSGDMVTHGENLKTKFSNWFYKEVCPSGQECYVSFIAHSWGTVILTDFLASLSQPNTIKVRTVVTFGSPVTGAQIALLKTPFWLAGIQNVTNSSNKINGASAAWYNIVNKNDPVAWDYLNAGLFSTSSISGVSNLQPNGTASTKGRLGEMFPVSNSEFDPKYLTTSVIRAYSNSGSDLLNVIIKSWGKDGAPNLSAHATSSYEPDRLVGYVINRIPKPTLSNLVLSCPSSIDEGKTGICSATAYYSNGKGKQVALSWSDNSSALAVSSNGTVSTTNVSSNTNVSVTGSYSENGKMVQGTANILVKDIIIPPVLPKVTSVSPLTVNYGQKTTFTVTGSNLPSTLAFWIDNCQGVTLLSGGTSASRSFTCTPSFDKYGVQKGGVKDKAGGTVLYSINVTVNPPPTKVTSVSPLTVNYGQKTTFTVTGSNLPSTLAFWIDSCQSVTLLSGGNSTSRSFTCTPSYSRGVKTGVVRDKTGGTTLHSFNVTVR